MQQLMSGFNLYTQKVLLQLTDLALKTNNQVYVDDS